MKKVLGFKDRVKLEIKDMLERISVYEGMSTPEKIKAMDNSRTRKGVLEKELGDMDIDLVVLGKMPDVAKYLVEQNDSAKALLNRLRETGDISYSSFVGEFGEELRFIVLRYLELLQDAKYVEIDYSNDGEKIKVFN